MSKDNVTVLVDFEGNRAEFKGEPDSNEGKEVSIPPLYLTDRESRLLRNCQLYATSDPAGMPGHNLAILVTKLYAYLDNNYKVDVVLRN